MRHDWIGKEVQYGDLLVSKKTKDFIKRKMESSGKFIVGNIIDGPCLYLLKFFPLKNGGSRCQLKISNVDNITLQESQVGNNLLEAFNNCLEKLVPAANRSLDCAINQKVKELSHLSNNRMSPNNL